MQESDPQDHLFYTGFKGNAGNLGPIHRDGHHLRISPLLKCGGSLSASSSAFQILVITPVLLGSFKNSTPILNFQIDFKTTAFLG